MRPSLGGRGAGAYFQEVAVADVHPNPHHRVIHFDEEALAELTASIAQIGVLQPVLVRASRDPASS